MPKIAYNFSAIVKVLKVDKPVEIKEIVKFTKAQPLPFLPPIPFPPVVPSIPLPVAPKLESPDIKVNPPNFSVKSSRSPIDLGLTLPPFPPTMPSIPLPPLPKLEAPDVKIDFSNKFKADLPTPDIKIPRPALNLGLTPPAFPPSVPGIPLPLPPEFGAKLDASFGQPFLGLRFPYPRLLSAIPDITQGASVVS